MHLEILYFAGCPNHRRIVKLAQRIVSELGMDIDIHETKVSGAEEAKRLRFLGSPTVLVNGVDIEPNAKHRTDYSYSCRVYHGADGLPPEAWVMTALTHAGNYET